MLVRRTPRHTPPLCLLPVELVLLGICTSNNMGDGVSEVLSVMVGRPIHDLLKVDGGMMIP